MSSRSVFASISSVSFRSFCISQLLLRAGTLRIIIAPSPLHRRLCAVATTGYHGSALQRPYLLVALVSGALALAVILLLALALAALLAELLLALAVLLLALAVLLLLALALAVLHALALLPRGRLLLALLLRLLLLVAELLLAADAAAAAPHAQLA